MPKSERYYSQQYSLLGYPSSNPSATGILQDLYPSNLSTPSVAHKPPPPTYESYKSEDGYKSQDESSIDAREPVQHGPKPAQPLTYDNLRSYDDQNYNPLRKPKKAGWSRRRKIIIFGSIAAFVVVIAIVVGVAVALTLKSPYKYIPSFAHVTNQDAFTSGGATNNSPQDTNDGVGAGEDKYVYYTGTSSSFPSHTSWISFGDMWTGNLHTLQTSCSVLGEGKDNSEGVIQDIYDAIQNRANASLVDHRFIFAVILQESHGCVHVGQTTSSSGVSNPGLMQSHNGHSYSSSHSNTSIIAMVQDGTQGTADGSGLAQNLDLYGDPYKAARGYNSGYVPKDGNLSAAAGATACYVSDIANRLTGWVNAKSTCPGDND